MLSAPLLSLLLSSCVTVPVPNTKECQVAGILSAGMNCAETITHKISELNLAETIDFLEPQPERQDPSDPTKTLPARAGAICRSADDARKQKDALDIACRLLGNKCTKEMKETIESFDLIGIKP